MAYHAFKNEEGIAYGSFEVFALDGSINDDVLNERGEPLAAGWYWWPCFPGCLPDGEPNGPFETEAQATRDARGGES